MLKQVSQMHADDADDDDLIAMETSDQVHIRAQLHAAENANKSHVWATDVCNDKPSEPVLDEADVNTLLQMICRRAPLLTTILPLRAHSSNVTKLALIYMHTLRIIAHSRYQTHLRVILSKLGYQNNTPQINWY